MDKVRHVRMLGVCLAAVFVTSAAIAQSASAAEFTITEFKNCPFKNRLVEVCTQGHTTTGAGGFYTVGPITVPILKSIKLQGGFYELEPFNGNTLQFVAPENNQQVIVPTAEKVPGEPLAHVSEGEMEEFGWPAGLKSSYKAAKAKGLFKEGKITEVIEAAGLPSLHLVNLIFEEELAIEAPIKITGKSLWLELLGGNCTIGSNAEPIVQRLYTGNTTSPLTGETLHGTAGQLEIVEEGAIAQLKNVLLIANTYPVPAAQGCGGPAYEAYLDPVIDKAFGIPAQAGASVTELDGTFTDAAAFYIKEHKKL